MSKPQETISRPDILAPAGGREQLITALNAGADAVYLGLKDFNARGRAENFSIAELKSLMPLARKKNCKILVTLNIVIKENEIEPIIKTLIELEWLGVHAVIIQDLGLAKLIKENFPAIRLHASTQLAIHNTEGVVIAGKLGFSQVVLARELTIREITNIRKNTPKETNLEVFCHGSLCYSYSGLCFFSGAEDARSGNRGECAYTCRKPYKILNEPGHGFLFSMKDLNTTNEIDALIKTGVNTLKIEGRMKDSQYVASTIGLYKNKINSALGINSNNERDYAYDSIFAFQRDTTSLFMNGRYDENVIDLNNPTHKGIQIGVIKSISYNKATFETTAPIELHDGLKIEQQSTVYHSKPQHGETLTNQPQLAQNKYKNKDIQFAIQKMEVKQKSVTSATKNQIVTITLPPKSDFVKPGDIIYKTRSNELKRHTDSLQHVFERERESDIINLKIKFSKVNEQTATIHFTALHQQELIFEKSYTEEYQKINSAQQNQIDSVSIFNIFGDFQIEAFLTLEGDKDICINKNQLKQIKKDLGEKIRAAIQQYKSNKFKKLIAINKAPKEKSNLTQYSIKFDRLEFLLYLEEHLNKNERLPITEIIFEPKRAFLPKEQPEEVLQQILNLANDHFLSVRLSIPLVIREWDHPEIKKWITAFFKLDQLNFEVGNLGGYQLIKELNEKNSQLNISADFTLYTLNHHAINALEDLNFNSFCYSIEDDLKNLEQITKNNSSNMSAYYILYKDTPLFIAEACSLTALHNGCPTGKVCGYRTLHIEDENGDRYFVAHESCKSIVYAEKPFCVIQDTNKLKTLGINNFRLDFLTRPYTKENFQEILTAALNHQNPTLSHTANLHGKLL